MLLQPTLCNVCIVLCALFICIWRGTFTFKRKRNWKFPLDRCNFSLVSSHCYQQIWHRLPRPIMMLITVTAALNSQLHQPWSLWRVATAMTDLPTRSTQPSIPLGLLLSSTSFNYLGHAPPHCRGWHVTLCDLTWHAAVRRRVCEPLLISHGT